MGRKKNEKLIEDAVKAGKVEIVSAKQEPITRSPLWMPRVISRETTPFVIIPRSPSVNNLYITRGRHRVKSPAYREWLEEVMPLLAQLPKPDRYPVKLNVILIEKIHRGSDGDNFLKSIQDAMVKAGVLKNDNLCYVTSIQFQYRPQTGKTGVRVEWEYDTA